MYEIAGIEMSIISSGYNCLHLYGGNTKTVQKGGSSSWGRQGKTKNTYGYWKDIQNCLDDLNNMTHAKLAELLNLSEKQLTEWLLERGLLLNMLLI